MVLLRGRQESNLSKAESTGLVSEPRGPGNHGGRDQPVLLGLALGAGQTLIIVAF